MPRPSKAADAVALVTGANRGIGLAFVRELAARGAKKVYAGTYVEVLAPATPGHPVARWLDKVGGSSGWVLSTQVPRLRPRRPPGAAGPGSSPSTCTPPTASTGPASRACCATP
jgi:hypothetical protein